MQTNGIFRLGSSTGDDTKWRSLGYLQRVLETNSQSGKRAHPHTRFRSKGCCCFTLLLNFCIRYSTISQCIMYVKTDRYRQISPRSTTKQARLLRLFATTVYRARGLIDKSIIITNYYYYYFYPWKIQRVCKKLV